MRNATRNLARIGTIGVIVLTLAGCATQSRKDNNTLLGAGLGAAAGAVLTDGDPLFTIGGAAAGGLLGNVLTKDDRSYRSSSHRGRDETRRRDNRRWNSDRDSRHRTSRRR